MCRSSLMRRMARSEIRQGNSGMLNGIPGASHQAPAIPSHGSIQAKRSRRILQHRHGHLYARRERDPRCHQQVSSGSKGLECFGVEPMRWVPFVLDCVLILYAVLLRTFIYFRRDVFALREWTTQYAWVVLLAFIILGVAGVSPSGPPCLCTNDRRGGCGRCALVHLV